MTATLFTDGPGPFDLTTTGVPLDIIDGVESRDTKSSYLRIHADLLDDDSIGDLLADVGAAGLGMWLVLLSEAKNARAFGILSFNAFSFGGRVGASQAEVLAAMRAMERAELIHLRVDGRRCMVRVRRWHRWQSMTDAEKSRLNRARHGGGVNRPRPGVNRPDDGVDAPADDTPPETGDRKQETPSTPTPPARTSAPVREGGAVAPGVGVTAVERVADAMLALYPGEPDRALAAAREVWFAAGQRKARFRSGTASVESILHGVAVLVSKRPWSPDDPVAFIVSQAQRFNPDAPDLSLPTIENGDPRDRLTIPSDPDFARFDG